MFSETFCYHCGSVNQTGISFCSSCGRLLLLKHRYHVINLLGTGGYGEVYHVEDIQSGGSSFAAKKLNLSNFSPDEQVKAIETFEREVQLLASLRHSSLPEIHEYFSEHGDYYLVMDLIPGETLTEQLARQSLQLLPIDKVVKIGIELATVLDYLHTRQPPIIFRDLKPDNIMLTPDEHVYLIDFGIARHFDPLEKKHTENLGTRGYDSPEHYSLVTTRSDIFSLGAILHQLLLGEDPSTYTHFQYPELHLLGHAQTQLANLVMRMLARDQQDRPASAAEVRQELQQILWELQQPISMPGARVGLAVPPTRKLSAAPQQQAPSPIQARVPGELIYVYTQQQEMAHALAWSPDGAKLASAGADRQVCVWQALDGQTIVTCRGHTSSVRALAWSPNSKYLASASNDHTIQIWQADSGQQLSVYEEHRRWVSALSWAPGAQLIASGDAGGFIYLWSPRTGRRQSLFQMHRAPVVALAYSPDGAWIASADEDGALYVWESVGGSLRTSYTGHRSAISALAWSPDGMLIASCSEDRKDHALHLWQAADGQLVAKYTGHQRMVNAIAWSRANGLIASAGRDQSVQIWDARTCRTLFTYPGHASGVNALSWSPDGHYLASAGEDGAIHVWWAN